VLYSSFVCISAYASVSFKTILRECLRAELPSGFPSAAPPSVIVPAVLGTQTVDSTPKKTKKIAQPWLAQPTSEFESLYMWSQTPVPAGFRQSGSRPGQTFLPINGNTTRVFPRPLLLTTLPRAFPRPILLTTTRVLDYSDDIVFLSHPPNFVYQLPAPLPDNSIITAITVSVWIVLFMWHTPRVPHSQTRWAHQSLPVTLPEECKLITTRLSSFQLRTTQVLSPSGFFFLSNNECCFAKVMGGGGFHTLGPQYPRYHIIIHGPHQW